MTTIILHGHLRDLYSQEIKVQANSAAEAIQSLSLIPELKKTPGLRHLVRVEGFDSADALFDKRQVDVLHIHPVVAGAGNGGIGQIVLGIVVVVVAVWFPYLLPSFLTPASAGMMGAMMILGGVMQMIAPQPRLGTEERSLYLGNGRNTVAIGTRIPMIYGRRKAYGQYISFDVDSGVFDAAPEEWYSSPFTNYGELTNSAAPSSFYETDPGPSEVADLVATYTGLTGTTTVQIHFSQVSVPPGAYDINFVTGQTLHVNITTNGATTVATVLGGRTDILPAVGTQIVFTQNHG